MMLLFLVPRYLHRLLPLLLPFISFSTDYSATGFQPVGHISLENRHIATSAASQNQFPEVGGCFGRGLNSRPTALYENKSQDGKRGYQFGDITKAVTKSLIGKRVSKLTGKPYEFGDLSRKIDESIKDKIIDLTGKDDYEFGDLSRWVDAQIKNEVNNYTNKDNYKFGDLTKEIARRVITGEYTLDDLFLLLKALALFEASISPVAGFMPVKLLIELLNFSIANDVAGRVSSVLAMELDRRLKKSLLGNENYQLRDATKQAISSAVAAYTGKDSYSFGDVTRKVVASFAEGGNSKADRPLLGMKTAKEMEPSIIEALDKWDGLSEKELEKSLAALEKYVEQVEIDDAKMGKSSHTT